MSRSCTGNDGGQRVFVQRDAVPDGARVTLIGRWLAGAARRDQWTWILRDAQGRCFSGYVVCAIRDHVELHLEAQPQVRLRIVQSLGVCLVALDLANPVSLAAQAIKKRKHRGTARQIRKHQPD